MRVWQAKTTAGAPTRNAMGMPPFDPELVLVFASVRHFGIPDFAAALSDTFPGAAIVGCSTAGEITRDGVGDDGCVVTALSFAGSPVRTALAPIAAIGESAAGGMRLGEALAAPDLAGVLLLGKGVAVNGSALIDGLMTGLHTAGLTHRVPVSGGLAGDGGAFRRTFILADGAVHEDAAVAVGFYGNRVRFRHGTYGGWRPFGPTRKITRADGNILRELDGEPALNIYKRYLGEYARDLPASGLLFPFELLDANHDAAGLIRTILGIDEGDGSLILAGAIEEGGYLRLMHASADALIDGAENAADTALGDGGESALALLVSCVGRKLVLGDLVDDEVEAVAAHVGADAVLAGFYSNGEIGPAGGHLDCKLHNQTMTITLIDER